MVDADRKIDAIASPMSYVRIDIDGEWTVTEVSDYLRALDHLYGAIFQAQLLLPYINFKSLMVDPKFRRGARKNIEMNLVAFQFSSPGFHDLAGIGKIIEQFRLFVEGMVDRGSRRRILKAEGRIKEYDAELRQQELVALKIENAAAFISLCSELELPKERVNEIMPSLLKSTDIIDEDILDGRIIGIEKLG